MKSRGQENGQKESHYHEKEGGIVCKVGGQCGSRRGHQEDLQANCQTPRMLTPDYYHSYILVSLRPPVPVVGCLCTPYLGKSFLPQFLKLTPMTPPPGEIQWPQETET